ncbi:MAG: hypothetical protein H6P98_451 [Candidatus Aminicenantes bacterium]|nr:hypothetical protein [Candidatus Aminicenantes bacterium]
MDREHDNKKEDRVSGAAGRMGGESARWRKGCSRGDSAARVFLEETGTEERALLLHHILTCPECHNNFAAVRAVWVKSGEILKPIEPEARFQAGDARRLKALAGDEIKRLRSLRRRGRRSADRLRYVLAGAAAVLLIIGAALLFRDPFSRYGLQERTAGDRTFIVLQPWDLVRQRPLVFRWKSLAQVGHYELEILDPGLATVYRQGGIALSWYSLPEEIYARLQRGRTYFWKVTAYLGDGQAVESEFGKFVLPEP